jgi:hypothetical protein
MFFSGQLRTAFDAQLAYRYSSKGFALVLILFLMQGCSPDLEPLITREQFDAPEIEDDFLRGRPEPGAPSIIIENPPFGARVTTPFPVQLRFQAEDGTSIDLDSLKIKYKIFNLTKKVIERMSVTESGISGKLDDIGPGEYNLKLTISDNKNRTGKADLSFIVVPES